MAPSHHHLNLKRYKLDKRVVVAFKDNPEDAHEADVDKLDGGLPWSDPIMLRSYWDKNGQNYQIGKCSFLGKLVEADALRSASPNGNQLQRSSAALKLAMLESGEVLSNTATPRVTI